MPKEVPADRPASPASAAETTTVDGARAPSAAEQRWETSTLAPTLKKSPERAAEFTTVSSYPIRRRFAELESRDGPRSARRAAVYPRHSSHDVSREAVDHAAVRGFRHRRGYQRALPLFARPGTDRAFGGVRPADPDGLRRGSCAFRRRSGQMRRGHQFARGHGSALRQNSAGRRYDLDDHQFARRGDLGDVSGGRGKAGRRLAENFRHFAERHPEGIHRTEGVYLPAGTVDAPGGRHAGIWRETYAEI